MQAGGKNIDGAGSLREAAVVRARPVLEADEIGKAQAAGRGGRGRSSRVPPCLLPTTPPGERR